jgi:exodeoxyribonuclease VII large subunit
MQPGSNSSTPLSVTDLTDEIKQLLENGFIHVWVEGELSHLNVHRSGHVYLTLKDSDARIDGVIWRSTVARLTYRPDPGEQVVVRGQLNVYAPQGSYKLIIDAIEPAGLGALQAALDALKKTLAAEGLFDAGRKREIPLLPRKVGVITSATGAARRDIESVIFRRSPQIPIVFYPAAVQGANAAPEIVRGLRALGKRDDVDVIIVGRGGGSIEDLWAFNEEIVARAIAACPTPVISAVGHETDTSISDLVADQRAPTPSAAAELAVPVRSDLLYTLEGIVDRMTRSMEHRVNRGHDQLRVLSVRLSAGIDWSPRRVRLERTVSRLLRLGSELVTHRRTQVDHLRDRVRDGSPVNRIAKDRQKLTQLHARLTPAVAAQGARSRADLRTLAARLNALSPLASLGRGFSIVRRETRLVRKHTDVVEGDTVSILLHEGTLTAQVTKTSSKHDMIEETTEIQ